MFCQQPFILQLCNYVKWLVSERLFFYIFANSLQTHIAIEKAKVRDTECTRHSYCYNSVSASSVAANIANLRMTNAVANRLCERCAAQFGSSTSYSTQPTISVKTTYTCITSSTVKEDMVRKPAGLRIFMRHVFSLNLNIAYLDNFT